MSLKLRQLANASADGTAGEARTKPSRALQFGIIAFVAVAVWLGNQALNYASTPRVQPTPTVDPTLTAAAVVSDTVTVEVTPTYTPMSVESVYRDPPTEVPVVEPVVLVVTATPTPTPTEVNYVYVEVTREVIIEVTPNVLPTPTVTPTPALASGTVKVCASVEGATALYVGGQGIVSGGCQVFSVGIGQSTISVQVNR